MIKSYSEFVHLFERKGPNAIATPTKNCCPHLPPGSTAAPCSSPAGAHTGTVTVTQGSLAVTAEASLGWGLTIGILSPDLRRPWLPGPYPVPGWCLSVCTCVRIVCLSLLFCPPTISMTCYLFPDVLSWSTLSFPWIPIEFHSYNTDHSLFDLFVCLKPSCHHFFKQDLKELEGTGEPKKRGRFLWWN